MSNIFVKKNYYKKCFLIRYAFYKQSLIKTAINLEKKSKNNNLLKKSFI